MINYNWDLQKIASYKHTNVDFVSTINFAKTQLIHSLLFTVVIALSCICSLSMLPYSFYYSLGSSYVDAKGFMNSYCFRMTFSSLPGLHGFHWKTMISFCSFLCALSFSFCYSVVTFSPSFAHSVM